MSATPNALVLPNLSHSPHVGFDSETGGRRKKGFNSSLSQGLSAIVHYRRHCFQSCLSFLNTSSTAQHKKLLCKKILTITTIMLTIGIPREAEIFRREKPFQLATFVAKIIGSH